MRVFASFLLLFMIAACGQHRTTPASVTGQQDIPVTVLREVPDRVKLLKVGMTEEEALKKLGLTGYPLHGLGGGPPNNYNFEYYLRSNCVLVLGLDMSRTPHIVTIVRGGFAPAFVRGHGWKEIRE